MRQDRGQVRGAEDVLPSATEGLLGLEYNWQGPVRSSETRVRSTLQLLESAFSLIPQKLWNSDWRGQMYLRRALMDLYVQRIHAHDLEAFENALHLLQNRTMANASCDASIAAASDALAIYIWFENLGM